jgi:hypothetical protein
MNPSWTGTNDIDDPQEGRRQIPLKGVISPPDHPEQQIDEGAGDHESRGDDPDVHDEWSKVSEAEKALRQR